MSPASFGGSEAACAFATLGRKAREAFEDAVRALSLERMPFARPSAPKYVGRDIGPATSGSAGTAPGEKPSLSTCYCYIARHLRRRVKGERLRVAFRVNEVAAKAVGKLVTGERSGGDRGSCRRRAFRRRSWLIFDSALLSTTSTACMCRAVLTGRRSFLRLSAM